MTEPNEALVEELARVFCIADWGKLRPEQIGPHYRGLAQAILPIFDRENLAAYQRGLRDAAAICDEVAKGKIWDVGAIEAAKRIRERLP